MKVVLFCGGFGMRLREYSESTPKPMVEIGYRPILWHIMKWYAHFGHKDFILCLGWKADAFKQYFLNYNECVSNDFVMSEGGREVDLLGSDIDDWTITFVDTGARANIGERLRAVEPYLRDEEMFLANYADGLSDIHLPELIRFHQQRQATATFMAVRPTQSFHTVEIADGGTVRNIESIGDTNVWMNAGFFVLTPEIFSHMREGEELVCEPFDRLIQNEKLAAMKYTGFYGCMDTYKEKQALDDLWNSGARPWALWDQVDPAPAPSVTPIEPAVLPFVHSNGHSDSNGHDETDHRQTHAL